MQTNIRSLLNDLDESNRIMAVADELDCVTELMKGYYGIGDYELIKAFGLDIVGRDVEKIMKEARQ